MPAWRGAESPFPRRHSTVPKSPQHRLLRGPCYGFGTSEQEHGAKPCSAKRLRGCKGRAGAGRRAGSPFQQPSRTAHSCWCVALLSGCTGISMYNTFFFFFNSFNNNSCIPAPPQAALKPSGAGEGWHYWVDTMQRDVGTGHVGARAAPLHFLSTSGDLSSSRWWSPRSSGRGQLLCGSLHAHSGDHTIMPNPTGVRHYCMESTEPGIPQHVPVQLRTPLSFPLQDSSGCLGLAGHFLQPPDPLSLPSGAVRTKGARRGCWGSTVGWDDPKSSQDRWDACTPSCHPAACPGSLLQPPHHGDLGFGVWEQPKKEKSCQ